MTSDIRKYENLHIAPWLVKDTCWVMDWKIPGLIMILPTLFVALHITWKSRNITSDLFHNIAVSLWICANTTWMVGEFYFGDTTRPFAIVFFVAGLLFIAYYYLFLSNKQRTNH